MNPELRRHLWTDLGLHARIIVPLVLGALAASVLAGGSQRALEHLADGAATLFVVLTIGWGSMRAFNSVTEEVRDRTWDFQRMAAISPASMALGKVFGAPILPWYVGLWCLAAYAVAGLLAGLPRVGSTLVMLWGSAVLLHALGVAASAVSARIGMGERSRRLVLLAALLGVVVGLPLVPVIVDLRSAQDQFIPWWGWQLPAHGFTAASVLAFAGWALLAAWRAMAREFREPLRHGPSLLFALFCGLWIAGLARSTLGTAQALSVVLGSASAVLVLLAYLGVPLDPWTHVRMARWRRSQGPSRRLPGWALDAPAAALLAGTGLVLASAAGGELRQQLLLACALALMVLRDAALVACLTLSRTLRNPVGRAGFYILIADLLLPLLLTTMGLRGAAAVVFPLWGFGDGPAMATGLMAAQAASAVALLAWRLRRAAQALAD